MNIPLNIDWQQILLHLFNFSILVGGLYLLLFKPVKNFMDKRAKHYQDMENAAAERERTTAEMEASMQQRQAALDAELEEKRAAAAKEAGVAYVLMGHGTAHVAKVTYSQMAAQMDKLGYENVFIGTVEGEPEDTSCEAVIAAVKEAGYTTVVLRPLMVVAGDHANNDMAGADEDSWKTMFEAAGFTVNCQISGLGRIADVQALYVAHTKAAIDAIA